MTQDSTAATLAHIRRVDGLLKQAAIQLLSRAMAHDASKLAAPEKDAFDAATAQLAGLTYGSPEYAAALASSGMKEALDHHYAHNAHHPEHYAMTTVHGRLELDAEAVTSGAAVRRMDLFDLLEMALDWKAASERHADGDIARSVAINQARFGIGDDLAQVLRNTYRAMALL